MTLESFHDDNYSLSLSLKINYFAILLEHDKHHSPLRYRKMSAIHLWSIAVATYCRLSLNLKFGLTNVHILASVQKSKIKNVLNVRVPIARASLLGAKLTSLTNALSKYSLHPPMLS